MTCKRYPSPSLLFAICCLIIVIGCQTVPKEPAAEFPMERISAFSYPDFKDDLYYDGIAHSIDKSLSYLNKLPADREFQFGEDRYNTDHMIRSLEQFRDFIQTAPAVGELNKFIQSNYIVYQSVGRDSEGEVLFTGYYEPHLRGSSLPDPDYPHPIYGRPADLITIDLSRFSEKYEGQKILGRISEDTVLPYYDRRQIDTESVLGDRVEILAWVKDPVDIFFLHIQGSGKIYLQNGEVINVHYNTSNGRPYRSIGKLLIDEGKISREEMSMQKIRAYLEAHPQEIEPILNHNPSYIFFKVEPEGPLGFLNVKLTPGRSIALDHRLFPKAALAFAETAKPLVDAAGSIHSWSTFERFVLIQDTGGAIRGAGRADLFWGNGPYAEIAAGHMKHPGKLFFLILKPTT